MISHNLNGYKVIIGFLLLFVIQLTGGLQAQPLDSLIKTVLERNPAIKSAELRITAAKFSAESNRFLPPPSLIFEATQVPVSSINIFNEALSNGIGLSQMIPLGNKLSSAAKVMEMNSLVAKSELNKIKLLLASSVRETYYSMYRSKKSEALYREQKKYLEMLLDNSMMNISIAGGGVSADVYLLQSELAKLDIRIAEEIAKQKEFDARFASLLNVPSFHYNFQDELSLPYAELNDSVLSSLIPENNPALQQMDEMVKMNEAEADMNSRELIPDLMLEAMIMRMPKGMIVTTSASLHSLPSASGAEYMFTLRASLTLPFLPWAKGKITAKNESLQNTIAGLQTEKQSMYLTMMSDLRRAVLAYQQNRSNAEQYKKNVLPALEKSLEVQMAGLKNGSVSLSQILNTLSMVVMEKMNYYMYVTEAWMSLSEIELMTGQAPEISEEQ